MQGFFELQVTCRRCLWSAVRRTLVPAEAARDLAEVLTDHLWRSHGVCEADAATAGVIKAELALRRALAGMTEPRAAAVGSQG